MKKKEELKRLEQIISILKNNNILSGINPDKLRIILEELGPTFIKLGQILSTRYDKIPKEYCESLASLRSSTITMDQDELFDILNEEYQDYKKVFKSIGKCAGSASIAEVYDATLLNGTEVVIKVKRKDIDKVMELDVRLLKKAIKTLQLDKIIKVMDLEKALDEMLKSAKEEMNFSLEKEHLITFKKLNQDIAYVDSPKVYSNISTEKVIVMEKINGITLNKKSLIESSGYDLEEVSYLICNNFIKQALTDGFYHADPHPDNIMLMDGKIVYLDLGMMGTLNETNKKLLKNCTLAIVEEDYYTVSKILVSMCEQTDDIDFLKLKGDVCNILSKYGSNNLNDVKVEKFSADMFRLLKNNNLSLNEELVMLIRAIVVIESTLKNINPNLSLVSVLSESFKDNKDEFINKDKIISAGKKLITNSKNMLNLPNELLTFVRSINNGETKFKFEMSDSTKQVDKIEKLLHELIIGIIDASLILAASLVTNTIMQIIFIAWACILSIWLIIKMVSDHFHRGY